MYSYINVCMHGKLQLFSATLGHGDCDNDNDNDSWRARVAN